MIRLFLGITLFLYQICYGQEVISLQMDIVSNDLTNCPENMTQVFLENKNETMCECTSGFLYYLPMDRCFLPYRQGPCHERQYLILKRTNNVSCAWNPCRRDGLVPYNGSCHELSKMGHPCDQDGYLTVDTSTFKLKCENIFALRTIFIAPIRKCQLGSRINARGMCRPVILSIS